MVPEEVSIGNPDGSITDPNHESHRRVFFSFILFSVGYCLLDHHRRSWWLFVRLSFDSSRCSDCAPAASMKGCRLCFCPMLHEAAVQRS